MPNYQVIIIWLSYDYHMTKKWIYLKLVISGYMYRGFLGRWARVRGQNWEIRNGGSNMAAKIISFRKLIDIIHTVVFWVADHDYEVKIGKFKMADLMWGPKYWFFINTTILLLQGFFCALSVIFSFDSANSKWRIQYGGQNIDFSYNRQYYTYRGILVRLERS